MMSPEDYSPARVRVQEKPQVFQRSGSTIVGDLSGGARTVQAFKHAQRGTSGIDLFSQLSVAALKARRVRAAQGTHQISPGRAYLIALFLITAAHSTGLTG